MMDRQLIVEGTVVMARLEEQVTLTRTLNDCYGILLQVLEEESIEQGSLN